MRHSLTGDRLSKRSTEAAMLPTASPPRVAALPTRRPKRPPYHPARRPPVTPSPKRRRCHPPRRRPDARGSVSCRSSSAATACGRNSARAAWAPSTWPTTPNSAGRSRLKVPFLSGPGVATLQPRFLREAQAAATLPHPNICPVFDLGEIDGVPYLTMASSTGEPLSRRLRPGQPLPAREAVAVVHKVALALHEAHAARYRPPRPEARQRDDRPAAASRSSWTSAWPGGATRWA